MVQAISFEPGQFWLLCDDANENFPLDGLGNKTTTASAALTANANNVAIKKVLLMKTPLATRVLTLSTTGGASAINIEIPTSALPGTLIDFGEEGLTMDGNISGELDGVSAGEAVIIVFGLVN